MPLLVDALPDARGHGVVSLMDVPVDTCLAVELTAPFSRMPQGPRNKMHVLIC